MRVTIADGRAHEAPAVDALEACPAHEPGHPLARAVGAAEAQLGVDARDPVRAPTGAVDLGDPGGQRLVSDGRADGGRFAQVQ